MRRRKPDLNQGELFPGFSMGGSESMPSRSDSTGPLGFTGSPLSAPAAPGSPPDAASAYSAAEAALNPPRPGPGGIPGFTGRPRPPRTAPPLPSNGGWKGMAARALTAPQGMSPLAAMGPTGAGIDLALRGMKAMVKPNPYGNIDTWRANKSSGEGEDLWMGRGTDRPGLYAQQTTKKYDTSGGRQAAPGPFPREYKDTYPEDASRDVATDQEPLGMATSTRPGGLAPPGPASDYMHMSRTSGTGTPWFDAHSAATSGLNTAPVASIRAPSTDD